MFSSKLDIISHFDNLIQRVDIDIEECLGKYNQDQVLGDLSFFKAQKKNFEITFFDNSSPKSIESSSMTDLCPESTKVVDYLNQIRMRTIDELRKAQEECLEEYKLNKTSNNHQNDELKSQTFSPDKFYFQVHFQPSNGANWIFNLFTFVTDFFIPPIDIYILDNLINDAIGNCELFSIYDSEIFFDEKMVLIGLLQKFFFDNLQTKKYPSHVIRVSKNEAFNIKEIIFSYNIYGVNLTDSSSIDLSNLETLTLTVYSSFQEIAVNIEGLSSFRALHFINFSPIQTSLHRLNSLRDLSLLYNSKSFNLENLSNLYEYLPNIERLCLSSDLSYIINLDSFFNLKSIYLINIKPEFNVDILKNISHQLEEIVVSDPLKEITYEHVEKLFFGHKFPNLHNLVISNIKADKIENRLLASFPMLRKLKISKLGIRKIDNDSFSDMKNLLVSI